jgi:hypothetical protein
VNSRLDQEQERIRNHSDSGAAFDSADIVGIADGWERRLERIYPGFFSCHSVRPLCGADVEPSRNSRQQYRQ